MSASATHWVAIAALFDEIVDLSLADRAARLVDLDRSDPAIAAELRALLAADADGYALLDAGVASAVPLLLDDAPIADGLAGPYRLLKPIGEGGMGVVWLAERTDGAYEQQVAVKVLKRGMDTQAILRRFLQERSILARLHHAHIVRLVDGGMSADGRPYFVMDLVDGRAITQFAADHRLDVAARVALLCKVADAVAYAHTQLIVHRDLKPSNVLVDAAGEPHLLDFGIAKVIEASGEQTMTGTGARVLSPAYAAPEQILGKAIGTATDVYALGLMLCELLVGQLPQLRRAVTPEQLAHAAALETTERASTLAARLESDGVVRLYGSAGNARDLARTLAGDLDLIIATAVQREPERRYATATALADDLRRWLAGRPISARADSPAYRLRKFVRRHRVGVVATALIAGSLLAGFGVALWQTHVAREAAGVARAAEDKARQQAAVATAVSDFLTQDVIQAANPYRNKLDIRLTDALIKGGERIDERFHDNPRLAGVLHRELGDALYLAAEFEPAETHARKSLGVLEAAFGATDADAIEARVTLGTILHKQNRYAEARSVYDDGLRAIGPDGPKRQQLELKVGIAGIDMEDRREAEALASLAVLEPAVEAEVGAFERLHVTALDHQMRALMGLEREDEALAIARRLRVGTERKFGVGDPQTLEWAKREGIVLTTLERYDEARPILEQVCAATRARLGAGHFATADCNLRLGIVQLSLKQFDQAVPLLEDVARVRETMMGPEAETTWLAWIWLARAYQAGGRHPQARAMFERTYANAIRVNGEEDAKTIPFGQTLGMFLEQTGLHAEAETLRRKLLRQSQAVLPKGHIMIAKIAWDLGETLASQQRDAQIVSFYAEWMPEWDAQFDNPKDSRRVDARKWLDEARGRIALRGARHAPFDGGKSSVPTD